MSWMHICGPAVYEFEGWTFEDSYSSGPWPLRKDGEPRARAGRKFWAVWNRWHGLPRAKREKYRIGGGCRFIKMGSN